MTNERRAQVAAQAQALPVRPGVYLLRNTRGEVIYIGKASSLKARVRSYFGSPHSLEGKTRALVDHVAEIDYVTTTTEQEALHLEATLVKRHQPIYNVRLRDDKHYPYLKIDVQEPWPRVYITRRVEKDGARYFGPYASAKSVRTTLDLVKKLFPWRSCTKTITGTDPRPCLDYHIHRCIAPCTSYCTPAEYRAVIDQTILFLEGRVDDVLRDLRQRMKESANALDYEHAAQYRDQITAVERVTESQVTATTEESDIDIFGLAQDGDEAIVQVLLVRGTKLSGSDHFVVAGTKDESPSAVLRSFLAQFYEDAIAVPRLVLIPTALEDDPLLPSWLAAKRGSPVEVRAPLRGEKRRLVDMATENAQETLQMLRVKWLTDAGKTSAALEEIAEALHLASPPRRMECYDISNTQGVHSVASMVVFVDGRPASREYRRFQIKTVEGADDFASMAEVLARRFRRMADARAQITADHAIADHDDDSNAHASSDGEASESWGAVPDLVIVDGGKGQVSAAHDTLRNLGLDQIPLVGLAKRNEELFTVDSKEPIRLERRTQGLYLMQRIRDEAHRFAISYHRHLRQKRSLRSPLDSVPGIGAMRKKALLQRFGSIKSIREAPVDDLAAIPGMTRRLAAAVKDCL